MGLQLAAVGIGAVVLLLRISGVPAWDSVYAEDQGVFLVDALAHPWHLFVPYGGYEELMPRLIGQLVSYLPFVDIDVAYALTGAIIAALCALLIYHALDGWIRSPWLRALVGAALILLPLAPIEIADNGVNTPWYTLVALFFCFLWRPRGWAGMTAVALVAFASTSSEILAVIYVPLVLLRLIALPRWREHAVTAGWLAGLLVQVPVVLQSYMHHTQRLTNLATAGQALGFYFHNVALRALGWRFSLGLTHHAGLNGATVIVCAILVAVFGWALVTGNGPTRVFIAVALIMGFGEAVFAATVVPYVILQQFLFDFEGGSRYSAMPIMAMVAAVTVAVDAYLRRPKPSPSVASTSPMPDRPADSPVPDSGPVPVTTDGSPVPVTTDGSPVPSAVVGGPVPDGAPVSVAAADGPIPAPSHLPRALIAVVLLVGVLSIGWVSDYRYLTERRAWGNWETKANQMLAACQHSSSGTLTTWTWGKGTIVIPCSGLRR
ncbi:MAG TPA: hypothetical protein VMU95_14055 [Trebonia sp.]|nr:hypothetical protein [Trebonia sp.]